MTPFITALIVSANFNGQPTVMAVLPFPSRAECEAAVDPMFALMQPAFPDAVVQCVDSQALASSPVPPMKTARSR